MTRKHDPEADLTVRPKSASDAFTTRPVQEQGLSIDPDDIGKQFLSEATEQGNFESSSGGDTTEINIIGAPPSDEPLTEGFEPDHDVWENTVDETLESGELDQVLAETSPQGTEQNQGIAPEESGELDLTAETISDSSLLDYEGEELGDVEEPSLRTDDSRRGRRGRPFTRGLR